MEYIYIGKIANTHGIKGELRIKSDFIYKDQVFKSGNNLYIGKNYIKEHIVSYRPHKGFDMVKFKNYNDINEVLKYKGENAYYLKEDLILEDNQYLDEDLIGLEVIYNNSNLGIVSDVIDAGSNNLLLMINDKYLPKNENFIEKVDLKNKKIYVKNIEGLL